MNQPAIIAVVGPTATGKSDLALDLGEAMGGPEAVEIVNMDAFQFYRGMDIGTAKLNIGERRGFVHHQLDVIDVTQDASVATYQTKARADIADIHSRGRRCIVVGGSGLYVRALLDHMDFPGTDPQVRAVFEARAEVEGTRPLYDELAGLDPAAAAAILPQNTRRIVRALEVIEITGAPYSANLPRQEYVSPTIQIGIDCSRDVLDERAAVRVDRMWDAGLVAEVAALAGPDLNGLGRTAERAVGYAEVLAFFRGEITEQTAKDSVIAATRRLARKQMGWFGRDPRINWVRAGDPDLIAKALEIVESGNADTRPHTGDGEIRRSLGS